MPARHRDRGEQTRRRTPRVRGVPAARTPLLLRVTIPAAVVAAVVASVVRAQSGAAPTAEGTLPLSPGNAVATSEGQAAAPLRQPNRGTGGAVSRSSSRTETEPGVTPGSAGRQARSLTGTPRPSSPPSSDANDPLSPSDPPPAAPSAPTASASATPALGCHVTYFVTSRSKDQYVAVLTIANTGAVPVDGWVLRWGFPTDQQLSNAWNASVTMDAEGAVATDAGQNRALAPGGSTTIGFVGVRHGEEPTPTGFTLNEVACR